MQQLFPADAGPLRTVSVADAYAFPDVRSGVWVRAVMVSSLDGAATVQGRSAGLSGPADERLFATLRHLADVILVGAGTVRIEGYGPEPPTSDPLLVEQRRALGQTPAPAIALVSASLDLDPAAALFADATEPTIVLTCAGAPAGRRRALEGVARVAVVGDHDDEAVDLGAAVDWLVSAGFGRISCEGGPHLLGALVQSGRLDELCLTITPRITASDAGRIVAAPALEPERMALRHVLEEDGFLFLRYSRPAATRATQGDSART